MTGPDEAQRLIENKMIFSKERFREYFGPHIPG